MKETKKELIIKIIAGRASVPHKSTAGQAPEHALKNELLLLFFEEKKQKNFGCKSLAEYFIRTTEKIKLSRR